MTSRMITKHVLFIWASKTHFSYKMVYFQLSVKENKIHSEPNRIICHTELHESFLIWSYREGKKQLSLVFGFDDWKRIANKLKISFFRAMDKKIFYGNVFSKWIQWHKRCDEVLANYASKSWKIPFLTSTVSRNGPL